MLDHTGLAVKDLNAAKKFYVAALQPLGLPMRFEVPGKIIGFGKEWSEFMVHVAETRHAHISFTAPSKEVVDEFYAQGLASGGKDNGAPGYRKNINAGHYAAFVLDPEGNNIEAVFHDPNPSE
jgi:catechol 2,3-dioxygenase-like lactoylglutathione lyase family enzyme